MRCDPASSAPERSPHGVTPEDPRKGFSPVLRGFKEKLQVDLKGKFDFFFRLFSLKGFEGRKAGCLGGGIHG
jgi:hypothetical protein